MILFYLFLLIPIIASLRIGVPSYRSSVMEGDKPILRMPKEPSVYESDNQNIEPEVIHATDKGGTVQDLSLLITWLVDNFGYDVVPQGRRNKGELEPEGDQPVEVEEEAEGVAVDAAVEAAEEAAENVPIGAEYEVTQKSAAEAAWQAADQAIEEIAEGMNDEQQEEIPTVELRHVKNKQLRESKEESSEEYEKNIARTIPKERDAKPVKSKHVKTLHEKQKATHEETPPRKGVDPNWMTDLKEFMKDLISRFGQKDLDKYTKPVITSLEKKHNVLITDIDVDQYGEILVSYIDRGGKKKPAAAPKALRYNPKSEEY